MCGRYTLITRREDLAKELGLPLDAIPEGLQARYNIAPTQLVPVLIRDQGVRFALFQWGLIPWWTKGPAKPAPMINARVETLAEKPSFRDALKTRRCLVLADGFFEWHETEKGKPRAPYYVRMKSRRPFTFAGLWSSWRAPSGEDILTCTIVTGSPNALVSTIHHRMPVIIPEGLRDVWLDPENEDVEGLLEILRPIAAEEMEMHPVTRRVNSAANDDPACIEPDPTAPLADSY